MRDEVQHIDDLKLWDKFQAGDQIAIGELYKRLFDKLFLYSYALTKNKESAKDMVQESFKKLIEQKPTELYNLEGWLKKGIEFQWRTEYRNTSNRREHLHRYKETLQTQTHLTNSLDTEKIQQLINTTLKPTNAKIIHLASKGYKNPEIAEELGLTEKQVRNRKLESKKKLKKSIGGDQF